MPTYSDYLVVFFLFKYWSHSFRSVTALADVRLNARSDSLRDCLLWLLFLLSLIMLRTPIVYSCYSNRHVCIPHTSRLWRSEWGNELATTGSKSRLADSLCGPKCIFRTLRCRGSSEPHADCNVNGRQPRLMMTEPVRQSLVVRIV